MIVYVPLATLLVGTVMVEVPEPPVMGLVENCGWGPLGCTVAPSVTVPVKPPLGEMVTV
jgi:hypothetical protein